MSKTPESGPSSEEGSEASKPIRSGFPYQAICMNLFAY